MSTSRIRIIVSDASGVILEKDFAEFPISFGRSPTSQILLPFEFISRSHCMIVEEDDGVALIDLHSSHGFSVGGKKIERVQVKEDLVFEIKTLTIKIVLLDHNHKHDQGYGHDSDTVATRSESKPLEMVGPPAVIKVGQVFTNPKKTPKPAPKPALKTPMAHPLEMASGGMVVGHGTIGSERERIPLVEKDIRADLLSSHPNAQAAKFRKIEAVVSWYDVIYDIQEFDPSDKITVGPKSKADISIPIFKRSMTVAKVGREKTKCFALKDHDVQVTKGNKKFEKKDLIENNLLQQKGQNLIWSIDPYDVTTMDFGSGIQLHLRYVPGTKALSRAKMIEPDEAFKQSVIGSAILHVALALMIFLMAPAAQKGPKLKNVPERYARLLIQKPKPKPTPPAPKPEVAKKEPPKPIEKPVEKVVKKQTIKTPKVLAKKNKYPMEVKHPIAKAAPPVKVEALGALGALGAMSKTANPNVVTNININPNAGGLPQKTMNTGGIVGALPSSNGKLAAAGGSRVKTKGFGYGTGTGYGMQGLKGNAGTRGVAGAIVGEPKLAQMAKVEGLTRAQVMAILKQYMSEVQHCYERNLLSNPDLAGRIDFEWDIGPSGGVTDVRVKRSTVNGGDNLVECVRKIFFAMPFPKAKNGMITTPSIGFPFGRI